MQEYVPLKEYARKNRISIFDAVKLARSGKVESIIKDIDGKEKIFIKGSVKVTKKPEVKKLPTIEELVKEIESLKKRVAELEAKL